MPFISEDNTLSFLAYHRYLTYNQFSSREQYRAQHGYISRNIKSCLQQGWATIIIAIGLIGSGLLFPFLFPHGMTVALLAVLHGLFVSGTLHLLMVSYAILNNIVITMYQQKNRPFFFPYYTCKTTGVHITNTTRPLVNAIGWGLHAAYKLAAAGSLIAGIVIAILDMVGVTVFPFHFFILVMCSALIIAQCTTGIIVASRKKRSTGRLWQSLQQSIILHTAAYITAPIIGLMTLSTYIILNTTHTYVSFMASVPLMQVTSACIGVIALGLCVAMIHFFLHKRDGERSATFIFLLSSHPSPTPRPLEPVYTNNTLLFEQCNAEVNALPQFKLIKYRSWEASEDNPITATFCTTPAVYMPNRPLNKYQVTLPSRHPVARNLLGSWLWHNPDVDENTLPPPSSTVVIHFDLPESKEEGPHFSHDESKKHIMLSAPDYT